MVPRGEDLEYYFRYTVDNAPVAHQYAPGYPDRFYGHPGKGRGRRPVCRQQCGYGRYLETEPTNRFVLFLGDSKTFVPERTYSHPEGQGDRTPDSMFNMACQDAQGSVYLASLNPSGTLHYELARVRFSEITDAHTSGTFSGTLVRYETQGSTVAPIGTVRVGKREFKVPRH